MKYSNAEKELIKKLYIEEGLNTVSISSAVGKSQSGIERYLKREGIFKSPRRIEISRQDVEVIVGRYLLGETADEIYKDFSLKLKSCDSILHLLKKNNINRRDAKRRSVIKHHNYFESIDSEHKAYFLGFLIADGSVINNRDGRSDSIRLELQECDRYIIDFLADQLGFTGTITKTKCGYVIAFSSQKMSNDLKKYGVVNNKTYIGTYLPELKNSLMPHLIRGIFDGDGTVYMDKNENFNWGFYGSNLICNQIQDYLAEQLSFSKNSVFNKGSISMIYLHSKDRTPKFYNYIYSVASIFLTRKKNKFDYYLVNTERALKESVLVEHTN